MTQTQEPSWIKKVRLHAPSHTSAVHIIAHIKMALEEDYIPRKRVLEEIKKHYKAEYVTDNELGKMFKRGWNAALNDIKQALITNTKD